MVTFLTQILVYCGLTVISSLRPLVVWVSAYILDIVYLVSVARKSRHHNLYRQQTEYYFFAKYQVKTQGAGAAAN